MFQKYSSLENAYRQQFIDRAALIDNSDWVALEKVHGANFSFIVEFNADDTPSVTVTPAKRSSTIGKNPVTGAYEFYGCNEVVKRYQHTAELLSHELWCAHKIERDDTIIIYGELYGEGIQKEVVYGKKDFIAYDIMVVPADKTECEPYFLDWDTVKASCENADIPVVPELGRGTLAEMLEISPEFQSIVGGERDFDNFSEGVVIKQATHEQRDHRGSRAIIKNKAKAFSEKKATKKVKTPVVLTDEQQRDLDGIAAYLTENRLRNVISKIGTVTQKDFGKLSGLLVKDALDEFNRDEYEIVSDNWKVIKKQVGKLAGDMIRLNFLNILDGNF